MCFGTLPTLDGPLSPGPCIPLHLSPPGAWEEAAPRTESSSHPTQKLPSGHLGELGDRRARALESDGSGLNLSSIHPLGGTQSGSLKLCASLLALSVKSRRGF